MTVLRKLDATCQSQVQGYRISRTQPVAGPLPRDENRMYSCSLIGKLALIVIHLRHRGEHRLRTDEIA